MLHITLPIPSLLACLSWLILHHDALLSAARLIGGELSARRVARIIDAASNQTSVSRLFLNDLEWLYDLFTLRHVGDPDRMESTFFAEVDPGDPAVEEVCLLSEALREHIDAIRTEAELIRAKRSV